MFNSAESFEASHFSDFLIIIFFHPFFFIPVRQLSIINELEIFIEVGKIILENQKKKEKERKARILFSLSAKSMRKRSFFTQTCWWKFSVLLNTLHRSRSSYSDEWQENENIKTLLIARSNFPSRNIIMLRMINLILLYFCHRKRKFQMNWFRFLSFFFFYIF